MRVVEDKMIAAIRTGKRRVSDNTHVRHFTTMGEGASAWNCLVTLFGNEIARLYRTDMGSITYMALTLAGWPTPTTRSRLNALCRAFGLGGFSRFGQEKGQQYYDSRTALDGSVVISEFAWIDVPTN